MEFYSLDKLNILANFLKIDIDSIHVWSDNSLTIGSNDTIEYFVTKGKRKFDVLVGTKSGYRIYKTN